MNQRSLHLFEERWASTRPIGADLKGYKVLLTGFGVSLTSSFLTQTLRFPGEKSCAESFFLLKSAPMAHVPTFLPLKMEIQPELLVYHTYRTSHLGFKSIPARRYNCVACSFACTMISCSSIVSNCPCSTTILPSTTTVSTSPPVAA